MYKRVCGLALREALRWRLYCWYTSWVQLCLHTRCTVKFQSLSNRHHNILDWWWASVTQNVLSIHSWQQAEQYSIYLYCCGFTLCRSNSPSISLWVTTNLCSSMEASNKKHWVPASGARPGYWVSVRLCIHLSRWRYGECTVRSTPSFSSSQFASSLLNNLSGNAGLYLSSARSQVYTHAWYKDHTHTHTSAALYYLEISNHHNWAAAQELESESQTACSRLGSQSLQIF